MDLIDDYVKIVERYSDAPKIFLEASAYHNVSALLGRFFRSTNFAGGGDTKPNIWIIISSIPARTRRSTVAKYSAWVYDKVLQAFFMNTFGLPKDKAYFKASSTIIEEGTPEGITDHIEDTGMKTFSIQSTEFGSVLQKMSAKEYQLGMSTILSKMYSGEGGTMMLSGRNRDKPEERIRTLPKGLYVTMFCGMQEPSLYITPDMARQGLLRRIILCYFDVNEMTNWRKPLSVNSDNIFSELRLLIDEYKTRMIQYRDWSQLKRPYQINATFVPRAMDYINKYAEKDDYELKVESNLYNIYKQSYWEHLSKLSILRSIARDGVKMIAKEYRAVITLDDIQKAQRFLDEATKHSKEIMFNLGRKDEPLRSSRDPLNRIFQLIKESGSEGIQRSKLYRKVNMKAGQMGEFIRTLEIQERIITKLPETSSGRIPITYVATKV